MAGQPPETQTQQTRNQRMEDLICRLIPYMEVIEKDPAYKPGAVRKLLKEMNVVLAEGEGQ